MSGNPFADDDPDERTVIRPSPGGRRAARPASAPPPPPPPPPPAPDPAPAVVSAPADPIDATLAAAAAPLIYLLARLRNTAHPPDAGDLNERAARALRAFGERGRASGLPMEQLRPAHYALCAALDDAVLNTPWGAASDWRSRSMVGTFHKTVATEDRFFDLLSKLRQEPAKSAAALEIMYLCLSLGYAGRYRQSPRGREMLDKLRADLGSLLLGADGAAKPPLSPRAKGIAAPYTRARTGLPLWVVGAATLAVCGALFIWVSTSLNAASDALFAHTMTAIPSHMPAMSRAAMVTPPPPPPPPSEPTVLDRLATALKSDIDHGLVSVVGTAAAPVLRVANGAGFAPGGASLPTAAAALFERIGVALRAEPGRVEVLGYTDNQPIHTVRFPSNFQLSAARAQAARAAIALGIGDPARLSAEGRADADPIMPNDTPEGRERNRRIEIVLHRQE